MTTPVGTSYTAIENRKKRLIRKAKAGSIFIASTEADHITEANFTDPTSYLLMPLPDGYHDLGWASDDGAVFSSNVDTSDVSSWGSTTPTRTDVTADSMDLAVSFQETNPQTIALYTGTDPQAVGVDANGVTAVYKPMQPLLGSFHVLSVAVDYIPEGEVYVGRYWPQATLTDRDDSTYSSGADPIMWPVTLSARPDDDLGTPEIYLFGGPGWVGLLSDMGLTLPAGV